MEAKKILITHIEEAFQLTINQLNQEAKKYYENYNIEFAKDGIKWNYKWRENIMSKDVENLRKHERVLNMVYKEPDKLLIHFLIKKFPLFH